MDFKKLMRYATANQMLTEKKHERKKQRQEDERNEEMIRQVEEERRAARRLKEARAKAEKQRREYKGLVDEAAQAKQTSSSSSKPTTTSPPAATAATTSKSKTGGSSSGAAKKVSNPATGSKPPPQPQTETQLQKQNQKRQQQPPNSTASNSSKGKTKAPVNFHDLLKIAQKKSGEVAEKEKSSKLIVRDSPSSRGTSPARPDVKSAPADARTCRGNSPVGKSLLERAGCRVKKKRTHEEMEKAASGANDAPNNSPAENMLGKGDRNPASKPTKNGLHPRAAASPQPRGDLPSTGGSSVAHHRPSQPEAPGQPPANRTRVSQALPQAARQIKRQRPRPGMDTLKTKSFYGAASAKLASAERPTFRTRHAPVKHTSAWVDEMTDYMQKKRLEIEGGGEEEEFYSDDEDEDDMADFVASDEEEGEGLEDYSSAIQQIFGYDKRRFAEEQFDDRIMESSYAQQMFEEQRSARIGQREDQEDLLREQAELVRKRQKKTGQKSSAGKTLTQTRLRFR